MPTLPSPAVMISAAGPCVASLIAASSIIAAASSSKAGWTGATLAECKSKVVSADEEGGRPEGGGLLSYFLTHPPIRAPIGEDLAAEVQWPRKRYEWSEAVCEGCCAGTEPPPSRLRGYLTVIEGPLGQLPEPRVEPSGERLARATTVYPVLGQ